MNTQWGKIVFKILYWLFLKIAFNLFGIDNLVDYSEFALMPKVMIQIIPIANNYYYRSISQSIICSNNKAKQYKLLIDYCLISEFNLSKYP